MRTWGLVPFGIGASKSDGLSPACYRPLAEIVSLVLPTGERLTAAVTWGGVQNAGGSGTRPYGRARRGRGPGQFLSVRWADSPSHAPKMGSGGPDRPSPLEKGAVAAEGGGWGFLLFCRGCGDGPKQRNPPSRLRRATSLFKGGFWRADIVRPYEGARRGQAPALRCTPEPMARSAEDARVSVKRENLRPAPPAPVPAQKVPLPTLPPCPVGCARAGAPRGGRGWHPPPRPGPSGPEGRAPRHSLPSRRSQPPSPQYGSPVPRKRGFSGGAGREETRRQRSGGRGLRARAP